MQDIHDSELVERAQNGHAAAVGTLYDRHHQAIFYFVWSRVGDRALAEDLTGDVFERMIAGLARYRVGNTPFRAWLYRIARNRITDHMRQTGTQTSVQLHEASALLSEKEMLMQQVDTQLSIEAVRVALDRINPAERDVVVLRFLMGFSLQEAAEALDKSVGAVKTLQHRGLRSLRAALLRLEIEA
ncbi:MAG: sigma-70 family RNA polymerase sigma factor [Anaerolineales bacterium]|nr:sigma-70 family RNA polymerase sigma factor [Anaerolineales bacterium]